jgi:hypothetical protein
MCYTINAPESIGLKVIAAAERDGTTTSEWFRRVAAKELRVDYLTFEDRCLLVRTDIKMAWDEYKKFRFSAPLIFCD